MSILEKLVVETSPAVVKARSMRGAFALSAEDGAIDEASIIAAAGAAVVTAHEGGLGLEELVELVREVWGAQPWPEGGNDGADAKREDDDGGA